MTSIMAAAHAHGFDFDRAVHAMREDHDGRGHWSDIAVPALRVRGEHSERITDEVYADARSRRPQLGLAAVPGAYHRVMLDHPAGFVAALQPFLARVRAAGR